MQQSKSTKGHHPARALLFVTNPTMVLLAVLFTLFMWRIPSRVQIDLVLEYQAEAGDLPETDVLIQRIQEQALTIKEGHIRYPEFPDIAPVKFVFPERLELQGQTLQVESMQPLAPHEWFVQLGGIVTHLTTGTPEVPHDRRLTQFDMVRASPRLLWTGIALWLIATILGWFRAYQALAK